MKNRIGLLVLFLLSITLLGGNFSPSDFGKISGEEKRVECPYLNSVKADKSSECPYLNSLKSSSKEGSGECPYLSGKKSSDCPYSGMKQKSECPYSGNKKDSEEVKTQQKSLKKSKIS